MTQLADDELKRNLQSLACAKYKILKKHPPSRDVSSSDSFSFNNDFAAPLQRIKISTIAVRIENAEERRQTRDRVEEERRHQVDVSILIVSECLIELLDKSTFQACIVRIMKDRKQMSHNDLITEVTRQLSSRFQPQPQLLKKRIESLIEVNFSYPPTFVRANVVLAWVSWSRARPQVIYIYGLKSGWYLSCRYTFAYSFRPISKHCNSYLHTIL